MQFVLRQHWACQSALKFGIMFGMDVVKKFGARSCVVALLLALAGCQGYTVVQRNVFADDNGNIVAVDYGRSERDHVNTFVSPATGKEMEFKSRLAVKARLPDGDSFTAWQCMNFLPYGTMYKTDSEEWMLLANGFSCVIYHQSEEDETKYREVYRGVLCEIDDDVKVKRNEKWKDVLKPGREYRKPGDRPRQSSAEPRRR